MCRSNVEGFRRCKSGEHGKAVESYQKALYYRAKKSGKTVDQWVTDNPEDAKRLQEKRDTRIAAYDQLKKDSAATSARFLSPDERRKINQSIISMDECKSASSEELGILTKDQQVAIGAYTGTAYRQLNKALLDIEGFNLDEYQENSWRDRNGMGAFKDYHDAADFINEIDGVLKTRHHEERVTYRGITGKGVTNMLNEIVGHERYDGSRANGHSFTSYEQEEAAKLIVSHYKEGTEIKFDSYVSTSLNPATGASWSLADERHGSTVGIIYEIKTNAGKNISSISNIATEREVLMPRGLRFKVANSYVAEKYDYQRIAPNGDAFDKVAGTKGTVVIQLVEVDELGNEVGSSTAEHVPSKEITGKVLEMEEFTRIERELDLEMEIEDEDLEDDEESDLTNW